MARGDGWLRLRGGVYYAVFYWQGRRIVQSLKTADEATAHKRAAGLRRKRERAEYQPAGEGRVTVAELLRDSLRTAEARGLASLPQLRYTAKAVDDALGHVQASRLTSEQIEDAIADWRAGGTAPATCNRRLEVLGRAYRLAMRRTPPKVRTAPYVPRLAQDNARTGFLEPAQFERLAEQLPPDIADFARWCYLTGMRKKEARQLEWSMLDRSGEPWLLRVPPAIAKNRRGRVLPLVGSLRQVIERRLELQRNALVFYRTSGRRSGLGGQVLAFDKAWRAALKAAGLPGSILFHDLRRSAARNLRKSGASETEAMAITGHLTRSVFDRYSITSTEDSAETLEAQDAMLRTATGHKTGHTPKRNRVSRRK